MKITTRERVGWTAENERPATCDRGLHGADPRRRGTGRALVEAAVAWCRIRPAPMILDWQARLDAVPFYDPLGLVGDRIGDTAEYPAYSIDLRT